MRLKLKYKTIQAKTVYQAQSKYDMNTMKSKLKILHLRKTNKPPKSADVRVVRVKNGLHLELRAGLCCVSKLIGDE